MQHVLLFFNLFALLTGVTAIAIAGFVYIKTRYSLLFSYLVYISSFALFIFSYLIILSYINLNIAEPDFHLLLFIIALCLLSSYLFMFSIPYFAHALISDTPARAKNIIAGAFAMAGLVFMALSFRVDFDAETIAQDRNAWMYLALSLYALSGVYSISIKSLALKRLDAARRRMVRNTLIVNSLLFPGALFDLYLAAKFRVMIFWPLFFCVFSLLSAVYINKRYLVQLAAMGSGLDESTAGTAFAEAGISDREKEIIMFMSKGLSNKRIAEELFISVNTVKTHVRNIFKKMNAKSRFELMMKLKNGPADDRTI